MQKPLITSCLHFDNEAHFSPLILRGVCLLFRTWLCFSSEVMISGHSSVWSTKIRLFNSNFVFVKQVRWLGFPFAKGKLLPKEKESSGVCLCCLSLTVCYSDHQGQSSAKRQRKFKKVLDEIETLCNRAATALRLILCGSDFGISFITSISSVKLCHTVSFSKYSEPSL